MAPSPGGKVEVPVPNVPTVPRDPYQLSDLIASWPAWVWQLVAILIVVVLLRKLWSKLPWQLLAIIFGGILFFVFLGEKLFK